MPLLILLKHKVHPDPWLMPRQDRLGTLVSLSISKRVANARSHMCSPLPEHQDCPFSGAAGGPPTQVHPAGWRDALATLFPLLAALSPNPPCHLVWHWSDQPLDPGRPGLKCCYFNLQSASSSLDNSGVQPFQQAADPGLPSTVLLPMATEQTQPPLPKTQLSA